MKVVKKQKNSKNCIVCGLDNPNGIKANFYNLEDDTVGALLEFNFYHQSYPGRTHGGLIASVLDEVMGRALWLKEDGSYAVTTSMEVKYRRPVEYGKPLKARAYIVKRLSRMFISKGEIYDLDNNLLAEGEGKYFIQPPTVICDNGADIDEEMCYLIDDGVTEIDFPPLNKEV
ncbi:MAG: PaaI family thioesterase [Clostridia bacterium]|nr:PaaI family thioesterase [Clostridia bacterium]